MPEIQSDNLGLTDVAQGSSNEATQANDANGQIDSFLTQMLEVDLASADVTLSADPPQFKRYRKFKIVNCATIGRALIVRAIPRAFWVDTTDPSNTEDLTITLGSTSLTLVPGKKALFETDGTTNGLELVISN